MHIMDLINEPKPLTRTEIVKAGLKASATLTALPFAALAIVMLAQALVRVIV